MKEIQLLDKKFRVSIPSNEIQQAIGQIAEKMNKDLKDKKYPPEQFRISKVSFCQ